MKDGALPFYENKSQPIHIRRTSKLEFPKHLHNHVELCIILNGRVRAWADNKGGIVSEGHAFLVFPNQIHHFKNEFGPADCILAIFSAGAIPTFNKIFLNKLPISPVIPIDLNLILPVINTTFNAELSSSDYSETVSQSCLSIILSHIFERTELIDSNRRDITSTQSILIYCNEHYTENITLEDLAQNTHLSKFRISHIFSDEIGISLPQYINSLRINDAKKLISDGNLSITEIAFKVGFNSIRSFNRNFLALTGTVPSKIKDLQRE